MFADTRLRLVVILMTAISALLIPSTPGRLLAQSVKRNTQVNTPASQRREQDKPQPEAARKIPAFKGTGTASLSTNRLPQTSAPLALDPKEMAKLLGREPGSLYAKLTPSQAQVANKGYLNFVDADLVEGDSHAEWITHSKTGKLGLWLKSYAGGKFLIDCTVKGWGKSVSFEVEGAGGKQTFDFPQTQGHLIFTLEAATTGWYVFWISASKTWGFWSCEVLNL